MAALVELSEALKVPVAESVGLAVPVAEPVRLPVVEAEPGRLPVSEAEGEAVPLPDWLAVRLSVALAVLEPVPEADRDTVLLGL